MSSTDIDQFQCHHFWITWMFYL